MTTQVASIVHVNDKGRTVITAGDYQLLLVPRSRNGNPRETWAKTRLYGAVDTLGGELHAALDVNCERPVIGPNLDDFASDTERDAHMKAYRVLFTRVTHHVKAQLVDIFASFTESGIEIHNLTTKGIKFSSNAGCTMCKCSPGFILANTVTYLETPVDLWLDTATHV